MAANTTSIQDFDSSSDNEVERESEPVARNLLQRLKAPKKSDLCRKRKIQSLPPIGKKRASGLKEPKVLPTQRVSEFPGEQLSVSLGRLFCNACRETLSVKRSTVLNHIKSAKHEESKAKQKRLGNDMNIVTALKK